MSRKWKPRKGEWVWSHWDDKPKKVTAVKQSNGNPKFVDGLYAKVAGVWTNIYWFRPLTKRERRALRKKGAFDVR